MRALWELARHQLGLITRAQALQLVTEAQLRHLVRRGHLVRRRRGVYVSRAAPVTYPQTVLAALLAVDVEAWASHLTAGKLHGLLVPPPTDVDVLTMPHHRVRLDGVAHHRNQLVVIDDVGVRSGVPATSVARTLVDCVPWLPGRALASAVDDALRRRLVDVADLEAAHAAVDEGPRTGRHLVVPMRPVLAERLGGQQAGGSDRELDVLSVLRRAGVPLPVQQHPVAVAGRRRFLDFAYPDARVYLEFDGFSEHGLIRSTFDDDRERDAELLLAGWRGLHFTSNTRPGDLVDRVVRALTARAA